MAAVSLSRKTKETRIDLTLNLGSTAPSHIQTGIGFLDHMLDHVTKHGRMQIELKAEGDTFVDLHHTVEDVAIVLGQAFDQALADMTGVARYGHFTLPMEETLCTVAIDIRKSAHFEWRVPACFQGTIGNYDCELVKEFFRAFALNARINLHVQVPYGENKHHIAEGIHKCFGRALAMASARDGGGVLYSTKGSL